MDIPSFLDLRATHNPHRWFLPVDQKVCTPGGFLFGGAGLAAAVSALESTCERPLIWATAQYLSFARPGSYLDLDVTIPVGGRNTTQARAIGRVLDAEIFTVNAALGSRSFAAAGEWDRPPDVAAPEDCPPVPDRAIHRGAIGARVELRVANGRYGSARDGTTSADGRSALWARIPDIDLCSASLAIIADWIPSGVGQALGQWLYANSLDNTIRIIEIHPTDWVLCDIRMQGVRNGYGHGLMHLWSRDRHLLATASQSVVIRPANRPPK